MYIREHSVLNHFILFLGCIPSKSGTVVTRKVSVTREEEEGVESPQRRMSTHSIRRNGGEYRSFISDDRFQVITCTWT